MEMPPPNEVSVVFFKSPKEYDFVDFCVRAVSQSEYSHVAIKIGKWCLHIGHNFPSQWILHDALSERWAPAAEVKIGDYIAHALQPELKKHEGQILSRIKCWFWGWFTLRSRPVIFRLKEPTTCCTIVRDVLSENFGIETTGQIPEDLYTELKEILDV